jgi:hypothetical protein
MPQDAAQRENGEKKGRKRRGRRAKMIAGWRLDTE